MERVLTFTGGVGEIIHMHINHYGFIRKIIHLLECEGILLKTIHGPFGS